MIPVDKLLAFLEEDAPHGDVTSTAIIPDTMCRADITAKQAGIIAGLLEVLALCDHFGISVEQHQKDGALVKRGDVLLTLDGRAKDILLLERTLLNIIGRMSGIATKTRRMADLVKKAIPSARVAATRKTCPGLRFLDKKAVIIGGGEAHRYSLSDQILIKDNHLAIVPMEEALTNAKKWSLYRLIEVEVGNAADAIMAAKNGADIVMLDNMGPDEVKETIRALEKENLRSGVVLELSGGIDEQSVNQYAGCTVDVISMGTLTHSVSNFDVSLSVIPGAQLVTL
jgi:nicotinate-nucleotide pyrophosphorylase (carboxylating)